MADVMFSSTTDKLRLATTLESRRLVAAPELTEKQIRAERHRLHQKRVWGQLGFAALLRGSAKRKGTR